MRAGGAVATAIAASGLLALSGRGEPPSDATGDASGDDRPDARELFTMDELREIARLSPLGAPPPDPSNGVSEDPDAAALGHRLFFEPALSFSGEVSCVTCHDPDLGFSDGRTIAIGEAVGERHSPSIWNAAYNRWQFWDGRTDSLWSQALSPMETMHEMGSTRTRVLRAVRADGDLRARYESIFGPLPDMSDDARFPEDASPVERDDGGAARDAWSDMSAQDRRAVTEAFVNIGKSIAAYERTLVSREAPFDRFVEGVREGDAEKLRALSAPQMRGLALFIGKARCTECHSGPNFTDGAFHDNRVPPLDGGEPTDSGRFGGIRELLDSPFNTRGPYSDAPETGRDHSRLTNPSHNWGAFKTPTLRNVALSPPYMHQGQIETLRGVLEHYNTLENATPLGHHTRERILKPLGLTERELDDLEAFLRALTDTSSVDPLLLERP